MNLINCKGAVQIPPDTNGGSLKAVNQDNFKSMFILFTLFILTPAERESSQRGYFVNQYFEIFPQSGTMFFPKYHTFTLELLHLIRSGIQGLSNSHRCPV